MSQTIQGQFAGPAESPEEAQRRREQEAEFVRAGETADFWQAAERLKQDIGIWNNHPKDIASTVQQLKQAEAQEDTPEDIDFEAAYGDTGNSEVLLGNINPQEKGKETQNPTPESAEKIPENTIEEQVYAPLINRVLKSWVIDAKQAQEIKEWLASWSDFQEIIRTTKGLDPKIGQQIIDRWRELNSEEGAEKFSKQFKKEFAAELTDSLDEKEEFTLDSLNYIATSYVSAGESTNPEEKKEALNMAMEMGVNNFLDGKQFERTEAFEIDLQNVKNSNLTFQERVEAFESIMKQVGTDQGAKAGKTKETNNKIRDKERSQHEQAIKTAEVALNGAKKSWNAEQLRAAEIALKEAQKDQKDSIKTWDAKVLGGGELDAMSEVTQEALKKAA